MAMRKITPSQMRKNYALAKEYAIDNDLLHIIVESETGREHISELTIMEAVKVIDKMEGRKQSTDPKKEHMTYKQEAFIMALARELKWVDEEGNIDDRRLNGFCRKYYEIESYKWLTRSKAGKVIEGLKSLLRKQAETEPA